MLFQNPNEMWVIRNWIPTSLPSPSPSPCLGGLSKWLWESHAKTCEEAWKEGHGSCEEHQVYLVGAFKATPFGLQYISTSSFTIFLHHLFSLFSLPTLLLLPLSNEISLQLTLFCVVATTSRLKGRTSMKNSSSLVPHTSFLLVTLFLLLTLGKGLRFTHHHCMCSHLF